MTADMTSEPSVETSSLSGQGVDPAVPERRASSTCTCSGCPSEARPGWMCWPCYDAKVQDHPHQPCRFCGAHIGNVTAYSEGRHELYCSKNPDRAEYVPDTGEDEARDRRHMAGYGWRESKVQ